MTVNRDTHAADMHAHEEHFDRFYDRLPKEFGHERALLKYRVWRSPENWGLAPEVFGR
jgi:phosphoenolpyruvate carboxykinase (GTP)